MDWRTHELKVDSGGSGLDLIHQEWLLTNGTGAYAMGTAACINTRRYHGLLVASTKPPVGRVVVLNQVLEQVVLKQGQRQHPIQTSTCAFRDNEQREVMEPQGYRLLKRFEKGLSARWNYLIGKGVEMQRELCLHWKHQGATLRYTFRGTGAAKVKGLIRLSPMLTLRDFHSLLHQDAAGAIEVKPSDREDGSITVRRGDLGIALCCQGSRFIASEDWWHGVYYQQEAKRGEADREDYFIPGQFEVEFDTEKTPVVALTVGLGSDVSDVGSWSPQERTDHLRAIFDRLPLDHADAKKDRLKRALVMAADDFVVLRPHQKKSFTTILAGYPWFADWGRDTFISMRGLLLTTGRFDEAKTTLRVFADAIRGGLVPNRFDDYDDLAAHYNSVDASLWFIVAAVDYVRASGDRESWAQWLADAVMGILEAFIRGTEHGIKMAGDGLITAGSQGTQLTWMDAACDGVVFTPRHGKAVEINALWYNGLVGTSELIADTHRRQADHYQRLARRVKRSFVKVFWDEGLGYLRDHVWVDHEGTDHPDCTLRPNQVFALSLPHSPLARTKQRLVLQVVKERLLTPFGLRTLASDDRDYHGQYNGSRYERDRAYHQGTVWAWLIGPYAEALLRLGRFSNRSKEEAKAAISPLLDELMGVGVGQLHEIYDADPPHHPVGCIAQAWSVAEVLRVLGLLADDDANG